MSRILVVDDEKSLRLLYKRDLEAEGYTVVTAGSAAEAFQTIESELPDLVVLDIRLPGMDGLEAMGRMLDKHPKLPVVLNTGYASYRDNFLSWGADAYIVKSSDTCALRVTIHELLAQREGRPVEVQQVA
jgi:two-component system response regulator (stage 0 sporulation protein F)